jgi:nucleoside-diphosphate-sugar epimerase
MDLAGSTVAVTGATGFIGRYLVRALRTRGARVVGIVRNPDKVPELGRAIELRRADTGDLQALTAALRSVDALMANAGVVSIGAVSKRRLLAANREGVANALEAARRAGVRRVVLTSSASVYRRKRGIYHEDDPLLDARDVVTPLGYYALSKALGERAAWEASRNGVALSVARPGGVYGAWDETGFTAWLRRLLRPPWLTAFPSHLYVPNVYAGDLAQAMAAMLERPVASGRAYNLTGDAHISYWDMLRAYRRAGGRVPPLVVPVPVPLRFAYNTDRARRELDFSNRDPVDGFAETLSLEAGGGFITP